MSTDTLMKLRGSTESAATPEAYKPSVNDVLDAVIPRKGIEGVLHGIKAGVAGIGDLGAELVSPTPMGGRAPVNQTLADITAPIKSGARRVVDQSRADAANLGPAGKLGELAGEIGVTAPLTPAAKASSALKASTGLAKVAGNALLGFGVGAEVPAGTEESRLRSGVVGAVTGGSLSALAQGGKAIAKGAQSTAEAVSSGVSALNPEQLAAKSQSLKAIGSATYQEAKQAGAVLSKKATNNLIDGLEGALAKSGKTNASLHADTLSVINDIRQAEGSKLSLEEADQFRQLLSDVVRKNTDKINGTNVDGLKAMHLIDALDEGIAGLRQKDMVSGDRKAVDMLMKAREQWSQWRQFDAISRIIQKAEGDNAALVRGFKSFADNSKNLRGFDPEVIAAIKQAAREGRVQKLLRVFGKFGIDSKNVIGPSVAGTLGYSAFGPGALALTAGGTVARYAGKVIAKGKAQKAIDLIGNRTLKDLAR